MSKYVVEFIGTFFLILTIGLSGNPIAIGFILTAIIYMGGYISGAHYNPAVTVAVLLQKKISTNEAVLYMLAQLLGGITASLLLIFLQKPLIVSPSEGVGIFEVLVLEALYTFALCSVVINTAVSKNNTPNQFYGLAIGVTLMAGAFSVGSITGGAFNPAVGVSPAITGFIFGSQSLVNIPIYIFGPIAGAVASGLLFKFVKNK